MNKLFGVLACISLLAVASSAVCGTPELVKVLEDREYWYSNSWDKFDESVLYKVTTWKLSGMSARGDVKTSDNYVTPIFINNLPVQELQVFVDAVTLQANYISMSSYNRLTTDDHKTFLNWCTERFGAAEREEEKRTEHLRTVTSTTISSYWTIGNTRIAIRTENNLSNGPSSVGFITTLSFVKNYHPNVTVTNDVSPVQPDTFPHLSSDDIPRATTSAQRRAVVVPASQSDYIRSSAQAVPAQPRSRMSPASSAPTSTMASDGNNYQPPPYIWESESGVTTVDNDISDVPAEKRSQFELKR